MVRFLLLPALGLILALASAQPSQATRPWATSPSRAESRVAASRRAGAPYHLPNQAAPSHQALARQQNSPFTTPTPTNVVAATIDQVSNLNPYGVLTQTRTVQSPLYVTVDVSAATVTEGTGQGPGITCALYYGEVAEFGGSWIGITTIPMSYVGDAGNADRYGANLLPLSVGLYEYKAWCSGDGGITKVWDQNTSTGTNGRLTVISGTPVASPTGSPSATPTSSPSPSATPTTTPSPTPTPTRGPEAVINTVSNLSPAGDSPQTIDTWAAMAVTVDVYARGYTDGPGPDPLIRCQLQLGRVSSFGGLWSDTQDLPMTFDQDVGKSDRYRVILGPLATGQYQYTAWCSGNKGRIKIWADTLTSGGPGRLSVIGTELPAAIQDVGPLDSITPGAPGSAGFQQACEQLIVNGSFEYDGFWELGQTDRPAAYVTVPSPVPDGNRAMRLGIDPNMGMAGTTAYSSISQRVTIPAAAKSAQIHFAYNPRSEATPGGPSRQELVLLDPTRNNQTMAVLWRVTENTGTWRTMSLPLNQYRGQTVTVYFNARSSGASGRTAMYLDSVSLTACYWAPSSPISPLPLPTPTQSVTPGVIAVPSPTTTPSPSPSPQPQISATVRSQVTPTPTVEVESALDDLLADLDTTDLIAISCLSIIILLAIVVTLFQVFQGRRS